MKEESNSKPALNAMCRAAIQAVEKAAKMDLEIPEWKNGKIIYVNAKEKLKKLKYSCFATSVRSGIIDTK